MLQSGQAKNPPERSPFCTVAPNDDLTIQILTNGQVVQSGGCQARLHVIVE